MGTIILPPKLRSVFNEVIERLRKKSSTRAIFVGGSIARGTADAYSDIDLLIITRGQVPYVRFYDGNLDIEIESVRLTDVRSKLKKDPASWHALIGYRPLYDPEGIAPSFRNILQTFVRRYHTDPTHLGDLFIRLRSLRQKARRPTNGRVAETILAQTILQELIDYHYAIRNRIVPRQMKLLATAWDDRKLPPAVRKFISLSARGALRTHHLVLSTDVALRKLKPTMRRFRTYYRPWFSG